MPPNLLFHLLLLLFFPPAHPTPLSSTTRDMIPRQIPGTYTNIQLIPDTGYCADQIRIAQVEPLQGIDAALYVIPHPFITLLLLGGGAVSCTATPTNNSDFANASATVLRRSSQIPLDERFDIIAQFRLAQEQFFLGVEVGPRVCGRSVIPDGNISMWVAPSQSIQATAGNISLSFTPGSKYIFYFPESRPCLYRGNAAEVGTVLEVPSRSPTPSPSELPSPSPFPSTVPSSSPGLQASLSPSPVVSSPGPSSNLPVLGDATIPPTSAPVCFPAGATVRREDGSVVRMDEVGVGERVLVSVSGRWGYSELFAFTHSDRRVISAFVRVETMSGRSVVLTSGHYMYVNGGVKQGGEVNVGDWVVDEIWGSIEVRWVGCVVERGLFNPQTMKGDLVVNGVLVTTYSSAFKDILTAHSLLAPLRFVERGVRRGIVEKMRCWMGVGT